MTMVGANTRLQVKVYEWYCPSVGVIHMVYEWRTELPGNHVHLPQVPVRAFRCIKQPVRCGSLQRNRKGRC